MAISTQGTLYRFFMPRFRQRGASTSARWIKNCETMELHPVHLNRVTCTKILVNIFLFVKFEVENFDKNHYFSRLKV